MALGLREYSGLPYPPSKCPRWHRPKSKRNHAYQAGFGWLITFDRSPARVGNL